MQHLGHLNYLHQMDQTYAYANHPQPAFIQFNLNDWAMLEKNFGLNFCLIFSFGTVDLYRQRRRISLGGRGYLAGVCRRPARQFCPR